MVIHSSDIIRRHSTRYDNKPITLAEDSTGYENTSCVVRTSVRSSSGNQLIHPRSFQLVITVTTLIATFSCVLRSCAFTTISTNTRLSGLLSRPSNIGRFGLGNTSSNSITTKSSIASPRHATTTTTATKMTKDCRFVTNRMCPFAQKAWIAIEAANIQYKMEEVSLYGAGGKPDWFWDLNPKGQVPVLVVGNDNSRTVLADSDLILDEMSMVVSQMTTTNNNNNSWIKTTIGIDYS